MRFILFIALIVLLGTRAFALNLTSFYYNDGNEKVARQDLFPPGCSTCTLGPNWNGNAIAQYSAKGETIGGALYLNNGSGSDATSVMVAVSSLTCQGGTGIANTVVASSMTVWNTVGRPIQVFKAQYVQMLGISVFPFAHDDIEERRYPQRFRTPYTISGSNQGVPDGATNLFTNRTDANKFYPVGLVPMEEFAISSFTVAKGSSQVVWIDTWISSSIPAGLCSGRITVTEGVSVSTVIPYNITVWNFALPTLYTFPAFVYVQQNYVTLRQNGNEFPNPGLDSIPPLSDTLNHYDQMLRAHGFSWTSGDVLDATTNDFPSARKQAEISGALYTADNGYANARGYATGDPRYTLGMYGGPFDVHWSTSNLSGGATDFCVNASSWAAYCSAHNIECDIYTPLDETTAANINGLINTLSANISTITACASGTKKLIFSQTGDLPVIASSAPYLAMPISADSFDNAYPSSQTWQNMALAYSTTAQVWRYNNNGIMGGGAAQADEEEGYGPRELIWTYFLKPITGYMSWDATYYKDDAITGINSDLYNQAVTEGGRTTQSPIFGLNGFNYSQGDGVWMWYGNDTVYTSSNTYGFDGPIATWQLKMFRRGIQDYDYMHLAYAVNPSSTTNIVQQLNTKILWDQICHDQTTPDCTYVYGDRGFSYSPNDYTNALISLGQTITQTSASPSQPVTINGTTNIRGRVTIQ